MIRGFRVSGGERDCVSVLICLLSFSLFSQIVLAGNTAEIDDSVQSLNLSPYLEVLPDEQGKWTIEDVSGPALAERFTANTQKVFNAGFTATPYWYRVKLPARATPAESLEQWFIEVGYPLLDHLDFYSLNAEKGWQRIKSGDQEPFSARPVNHRNFVFPIRLAQDGPTVVYLRVQTQSSHELPLTLLSAEALRRGDQNNLLLLGGFYGLVLGLLLYNALIFLAVRERSHFDYVLAILFVGLIPLCLNGLGPQYFWGDSPRWINISAPFSMCMVGFWATRFMQSFLQLRLNAPRLDRLITAIQCAGLAGALLAFMVDYSTSIRVALAVAGCAALAAMVVPAWLFVKGLSAARFFLLGASAFVISTLVKIAQVTDVLATNILTLHAVQFGAAISAVLFSLALADKINMERQERERLSRLKRFFSPEVAAAILVEGGGALLEAKRRDVTVVFTDLRGFTQFAAQSEPEEVMQVLRQYHEVVGRTVSLHQGTLEHFAGDGVMIYFNAPVEIGDPEVRAVRMAFDLRQQFETLCAGWKQRGFELGVGIGIASGFATIGAVGWEGRQDYAAIGNVTNLASRLCGQAEHGQILASQRLHAKLDGLAEVTDMGEQTLKGIPKPVQVFNLVRLNAAV